MCLFPWTGNSRSGPGAADHELVSGTRSRWASSRSGSASTAQVRPQVSRTAAMVDEIVRLGWDAVDQAQKERQERIRAAAGPNGGLSTTKERYNSWVLRWRTARALKAKGVHPKDAKCPVLFHHRTGLRKLVRDVENFTPHSSAASRGPRAGPRRAGPRVASGSRSRPVAK